MYIPQLLHPLHSLHVQARKQIQNVLTVEWDTHKTVLVEVPGAPPVDTDVEMEGMGLNRKDEGYGRLDDDWDDHEVGLSLTSPSNIQDGEMEYEDEDGDREMKCGLTDRM